MNGKVLELRAGLQLLSQPDGLTASTSPGVAFLVAIFNGDLSALIALLRPRRPAPTSAPNIESCFSSLIDFEVDCLQLQVEAPPQNLSVDYDEAFDMKALAERARAEAGVPQKIWDRCTAKIS